MRTVLRVLELHNDGLDNLIMYRFQVNLEIGVTTASK